MPPRGQLGGQRFADVLRSSGDNGTCVGTGRRYRHEPIVDSGRFTTTTSAAEPTQQVAANREIECRA
ncbi:short-chain dehydrogenase/reductase family oxidoreductase domain protein [Mycobacterium ulcerans str. Harvey]|uniref:Short-chain dehydrogenase/reductase family oxidoreductase domain protein n=1 Tax=Mycobacterium ulcerans str. Harvey TaxID=1299332 RepID=A0ABN0QRT1_MYCUL|nr:short-chain dehydrogenase/reductase family oxidoreductase domain protein [Mycobacterium ulcerans str. Harvey]